MISTLRPAALAIAVLVAIQPPRAGDNAALRRELQSIYDRASTAQRLARTLADLDDVTEVSAAHVALAAMLREDVP